jgi:lipoprotein signal peptidase
MRANASDFDPKADAVPAGELPEPKFHGGFFPRFNVADGAITLGACCLILDEILRARRARA